MATITVLLKDGSTRINFLGNRWTLDNDRLQIYNGSDDASVCFLMPAIAGVWLEESEVQEKPFTVAITAGKRSEPNNYSDSATGVVDIARP